MKIEKIKRKEFYRDIVKKRNHDVIEEKKNKTLWRLEKISLRSNNNKNNTLSRRSFN